MSNDIKKFLADHFITKQMDEIDLTDNENDLAFTFLLCWSLLETRYFGGDLSIEKIKATSKSIKSEEFNEEVRNLHTRYQNADHWRNLKYNGRDHKIDNDPEMEAIRGKDFVTLGESEKTKFGLYVIFRFKKNLLVGTLGLASWLQAEIPIVDCIKAMIIYLKDA